MEWDQVTEVVLSRDTLEEFDRRTQAQHSGAEITASRSLELPCGRQRMLLKRFAQHGGPSLTHIRGFACRSGVMNAPSDQNRKPSVRSAPSGLISRPTNETKTSRTGAYCGDFRQTLIDQKIYPYKRMSKPGNWDYIQKQLARPRASLSSSHFADNDFDDFFDTCQGADTEALVLSEVLPMIAGGRRKEHTCGADTIFDRICPLNKIFTKAKPDRYDGAQPETIDEQVRTQIHDMITPTSRTSQPAAPNFFLECKGLDGSMHVAQLQACHYGAIGARAMHSLQNYLAEEPEYDGNAYSFSATYVPGLLQLYSIHPVAPAAKGGPTQYHMVELDSFAMTGNIKKFREGATAYRNARDMAKRFRDSHIEKANNAARALPAQILTNNGPSQSEAGSDISADELAPSPPQSKRPRHK